MSCVNNELRDIKTVIDDPNILIEGLIKNAAKIMSQTNNLPEENPTRNLQKKQQS
jgi:hypothetical protein